MAHPAGSMRKLAAILLLALAARQVAMRGWGLRPGEASRTLPGDDVVSRPDQQLTHGITVAAAPAEVWPWIAQMGYGRGGWYTPRWVDRYIWRVDAVSLDRIDVGLGRLEAGDVILDGPPGTATFDVVDVRPHRALVLHSRRHPLTGVAPDLAAPQPGPYLDFSWTFVLDRDGPDATRLLLRTRGIAHLHPVSHALAWLLWPFIDYAMARWMLLGIKERVERRRGVEPPFG